MNPDRDKIASSRSRGCGVGIFWLLADGMLLVDKVPLPEAEPYGDCLTHPRSHTDQWEEFRKQRIIPADVEYEEYPRGRVSFDMKRNVFMLFADRCILKQTGLVTKLISEMHLPRKGTEVGADPHYLCYRCLHGGLGRTGGR